MTETSHQCIVLDLNRLLQWAFPLHAAELPATTGIATPIYYCSLRGVYTDVDYFRISTLKEFAMHYLTL